MKHKLKIISKAFLCFILCLSMLAPSLTSFAAGGGDAATDDYGTADGIPNNQKGLNSLSGISVAVSLMKVDNTSEQYQEKITAHNLSNSEAWSEMGVSIVDNYLNDYPVDMLQSNALKDSAIIRLKNTVSGTQPMRYVSMSGKYTNDRLTNIYIAEGKPVPTDFSGINIVGNAIKNDSTYYSAFKNKTLDIATVMGLVNTNSSGLKEWSDKFVALWANEDNVDTVLNGMFTDNDYYGNLLKYLDLLLVINNLCNDTQEELVSKFLKKLNQDGSDDFVTICAIQCVNSYVADGTKALIPLPVYYALTTSSSYTAYTHFERDGGSTNPVDPADASISYESNKEGYIADLKDKYYKVKTQGSGRYTWLWNARDLVWWDSSRGYGIATSLRPTDMNDKSTGNCSYTFLARGLKVASPSSIVASLDNIPSDDSPLGQFAIEATSDSYDVKSGEEVTANFSIDLKLTEQQRQNATSDRR